MLPKKIDYALFDFDGVIADTEPLYMELDRAALANFGYDATDDDLRGFIGKASEVEGPALLARHGIAATTGEYLAVWDPDLAIYGNPELKPSPGLPELWARLSAGGVRIAVVSTTRTVSLVRALNAFDLLRYVSVVVGREMVSRTKPDPEPYLVALDLLARGEAHAAERAIAFDDSSSGVASAKAAGIYTVCYAGASQSEPVAAADAVITSFNEADFLL